MESEALVTALRSPRAYPRPTDTVDFLETHISLLFFASDRVYKVKKAVDLGFLDFTTLERRKHYCEEEVRLNRRMTSGVYLGVVPIVRAPDHSLRVGGPGQIVEWAVEMIRLPEQHMLARLLDHGSIDNEKMNDLAALLADFHARAPTGAGVDEYGSVAAITENVEENFDQLRPFVDFPDEGAAAGVQVLSSRQFAFLRERSRAFLATRRDFLEQRVEQARIRDGHGDLHAGNICFTDAGIVAYDCIEFSQRYRCGDVAADLAFLGMDLDSRGYPGFSKYLVKRYASVADDDELRELEDFYKAYRALVRAKVAALTVGAASLATSDREEKRREAMRYAQLAVTYELPPALILMCGLPACGKSWLAKRLARPMRAAVVHSDVRRKLSAGLAPTTRVREGWESGLYSSEMKRKTYRALLESSLRSLQRGTSVIVDATFSKREFRSEFIDAAARLGLPYYVVHVTASDAVTRARLVERSRDESAVSDADLDVYLAARETFEPPSEAPRRHVVEVSSDSGSPEESSSVVIDRMIELCAPARNSF